jgi:histone-lysine N-methyltransferase SETD7
LCCPIYAPLNCRENGGRYEHIFGRNDGPVAQAGPADRTVVTVVRESTTLPVIFWQWVSRYRMDGLLYGRPDHEGRLTGPNITFIYPDFETALHGTFDNGQLVEGVAMRIVGRRCRGGILELRLRPSRFANPLPWRRDADNRQLIRANARRMDPFERRSVYAATSHIPGANEGVFAKRDFVAGDLVSYFVGLYTKEAHFIFDNQTSAEYEEARAYYFNLGSHSPTAWGLDKDTVMDMPPDLRSIVTFRTTLGHKINHKVRGKKLNYFAFY